jgi:hypothetical protein
MLGAVLPYKKIHAVKEYFATKLLTHKIGYRYTASLKTKKSRTAKTTTGVFSFHTQGS